MWEVEVTLQTRNMSYNTEDSDYADTVKAWQLATAMVIYHM
jgi:hypothetical protein